MDELKREVDLVRLYLDLFNKVHSDKFSKTEAFCTKSISE